MTAFDDRIPEEMEPQQQEFLQLLHRVSHHSAPEVSQDQEQIIRRVREHLVRSNPNKVEESNIMPQSLITHKVPSQPQRVRRRTQIVRVINSLAAVLVVSIIAGASLFLFAHRSQPTGTSPKRPIQMNTTAHSQAGGLEMSMNLTSGPYFLSEMIAVDISLTNHTHTTFSVGTPFAGSPCGYISGITMTGGNAPYYTVPIGMVHSCPPMFNSISLQPGQTLTATRYVPLTSSGSITLRAETQFFTTRVNANGNRITARTSSPLDGHWPSIQLHVSSSIPTDKQLSLRKEGIQVIITAPQQTQPRLFYSYSLSCQAPQSSEGFATGNYTWEPLSVNKVNEPDCSGRKIHWMFAFGAPGYAIITGSLP